MAEFVVVTAHEKEETEEAVNTHIHIIITTIPTPTSTGHRCRLYRIDVHVAAIPPILALCIPWPEMHYTGALVVVSLLQYLDSRHRSVGQSRT